MAKFTAYVETNKVGSRCIDDFEVPDEDLEGLSDEARNQLIEDYAKDVVFDGMMFEWGWVPEGEIRE